MKKILFVFAFVALIFTMESCTQDGLAPSESGNLELQGDGDPPGGSGHTPIKPPPPPAP